MQTQGFARALPGAEAKAEQEHSVAIYHLSVKAISRAKGRSATAAAAYRAGGEIVDARTGECHDYSRKRGVLSATIIAPPGAPEWAHDRAALWNAAEASETRRNATVAREFEIALPAELNAEQRQQLAHEFAREIMERHGCVVDVAIHAPDRGRRHVTEDGDERVEREGGDPRNQHAHLLCSTRRLTPDGFGDKTRELDDLKTGEVTRWRARWAELANEHLERAGHTARIDHRSLAAQGIDREPTQHLGPAATGYERRTGEPSWLRQMHEQEAAQARLEAAAKVGQNLPHAEDFGASIIDLETQLRAAVAERDQRQSVILDALHQWRGYLGPQRPEAAQAIAIAAQVRRRQPGAIEQAEELARGLSAGEKAAQARAEAERQAAEHRAKLEAERAAKRAQEAALLDSLRAKAQPSPAPRSGLADQLEAYTAARRQERAQHAETRAPEPRGGDAEQQRQDAFRALLERQQQAERERKETPEQAPEQDHDWGMDGP